MDVDLSYSGKTPGFSNTNMPLLILEKNMLFFAFASLGFCQICNKIASNEFYVNDNS
jgi:hypothetical protein